MPQETREETPKPLDALNAARDALEAAKKAGDARSVQYWTRCVDALLESVIERSCLLQIR